jgi:hypothetical protein
VEEGILKGLGIPLVSLPIRQDMEGVPCLWYDVRCDELPLKTLFYLI